MTLWMSHPVTAIPDASIACSSRAVDIAYLRLFAVYGVPVATATDDSLVVPRAPSCDAEELAATAVRHLNTRAREADSLIDCRSAPAEGRPAPTYMLADLVDLRRSRLLSISGRSGTELAYAFWILLVEPPSKLGTIVAATQVLPAPDPRFRPNALPLGDAAAAIHVTPWDDRGEDGWRIRSIRVLEGSPEPVDVIAAAACRANLQTEDIRWLVAHRWSLDFVTAVHLSLPRAHPVQRAVHRSVDFGVADVLVSLAEVARERLDGIGVLVLRGATGSMAAVLLEPAGDP